MIPLKASGVIGLCGYATCGKDFLYSLLSKRGKTTRLALADSLKSDINPFLIDKLGIDIWKCSPQEKELVRPLLVAYGKIHRNRSGGTYFTSQLNDKIKDLSKDSLVIVTDVRYADPKFPNDELQWIKSIGGRLVHISKYFEDEKGVRTFTKPPNQDELENDCVLVKHSDFQIEWKHSSESLIEVEDHVSRLVEYLNEEFGDKSKRANR